MDGRPMQPRIAIANSQAGSIGKVFELGCPDGHSKSPRKKVASRKRNHKRATSAGRITFELRYHRASKRGVAIARCRQVLITTVAQRMRRSESCRTSKVSHAGYGTSRLYRATALGGADWHRSKLQAQSRRWLWRLVRSIGRGRTRPRTRTGLRKLDLRPEARVAMRPLATGSLEREAMSAIVPGQPVRRLHPLRGFETEESDRRRVPPIMGGRRTSLRLRHFELLQT